MAALSLSPQQFHALLTVFSKLFPPFPHDSGSLSVSRQYSAFDGMQQLSCVFTSVRQCRQTTADRYLLQFCLLTLAWLYLQVDVMLPLLMARPPYLHWRLRRAHQSTTKWKTGAVRLLQTRQPQPWSTCTWQTWASVSWSPKP